MDEQKEVGRVNGVPLVIDNGLCVGNMPVVLSAEARQVVLAMKKWDRLGLVKIAAAREENEPGTRIKQLTLYLYFGHNRPKSVSYAVSQRGTKKVPFFALTRLES
ncbi:MAG: hypothetical protein Q8P49_04715 [Candidatus Liptonbacteria bacterium]|nr:hypothetical protein [Candidatus Liptonbacteria bacterium]